VSNVVSYGRKLSCEKTAFSITGYVHKCSSVHTADSVIDIDVGMRSERS